MKDMVPRDVITGGKAAGSYIQAKHIIRIIHGVSYVENNDASVGNFLKVFFLFI